MTPDTKIGLLLGLVLIFIIAFLINGFGIGDTTNNNELTSNMVNSPRRPTGIGAIQRKISREMPRQEIRYKTDLPRTKIIAKPPIAAAPDRVIAKRGTAIRTAARTVSLGNKLPMSYVVSSGDNLAVIAKKFYGPVEGNKRVNIAGIFKANRKTLRSSDQIRLGQRIIIPPLAALTHSRQTGKITAGRRNIAGGRGKIRICVVRDGDSLWSLAAEKLGNGARYREIVKLNNDLLGDEDRLVIGMRLKVPVR